jgi:hypothetical protein
MQNMKSKVVLMLGLTLLITVNSQEAKTPTLLQTTDYLSQKLAADSEFQRILRGDRFYFEANGNYVLDGGTSRLEIDFARITSIDVLVGSNLGVVIRCAECIRYRSSSSGSSTFTEWPFYLASRETAEKIATALRHVVRLKAGKRELF